MSNIENFNSHDAAPHTPLSGIKQVLNSIDPPPIKHHNDLNTTTSTWLPAISEYLMEYPFGDDSTKVVGYNEFVKSNLTCDEKTSNDGCTGDAKIYMRHTPLGKVACQQSNGKIYTSEGWNRGIIQGLSEDISDFKRYMRSDKVGNVKCMRLKGAVGRRINDESKFREGKPADVDTSDDTGGTWWHETHCVPHSAVLTIYEGKDTEYKIPIPDCEEEDEEETEEKEAFVNAPSTQSKQKRPLVFLFALIALLILVLLLLIKYTALSNSIPQLLKQRVKN